MSEACFETAVATALSGHPRFESAVPTALSGHLRFETAVSTALISLSLFISLAVSLSVFWPFSMGSCFQFTRNFKCFPFTENSAGRLV